MVAFSLNLYTSLLESGDGSGASDRLYQIGYRTFEQNFRTQVPNSSFKLGNNAERFLMETAWSLKQQKAILNFRILDFHNVHFLFLLSFTFTRSVPLVTGSFGLTKLNESPDGRHNTMTQNLGVVMSQSSLPS